PLRQRRSCCACASPPRRLACASSYEPLLRCLIVSAGRLRPPRVVFGQGGAVHQGHSRPLQGGLHRRGPAGLSSTSVGLGRRNDGSACRRDTSTGTSLEPRAPPGRAATITPSG